MKAKYLISTRLNKKGRWRKSVLRHRLKSEAKTIKDYLDTLHPEDDHRVEKEGATIRG